MNIAYRKLYIPKGRNKNRSKKNEQSFFREHWRVSWGPTYVYGAMSQKEGERDRKNISRNEQNASEI